MRAWNVRTVVGSVAVAGVLAAMAWQTSWLGRVATAAQQTVSRRGANPRLTPAYRPGELVVKFKPEVRPPAAQLSQRRQSFAPYTGSPHLDALHQQYGVTAMQPLFALPQSAARRRNVPDASPAEWEAHVQSVRQRFPTRAQRAEAKARVPDLSTIYTLTVLPDTDVQQLAAEYAADPSVEYAEPIYTRQLFFTPNDPFFSSSGSWGQKFPDLWGLHNIHADTAWDLSTGAGVTVAVVDTGLFRDHPDIAANVWTNPGEIPGNGIDDDGNGFVDDLHGWDFPGQTADVQDDFVGHGTYVAGTIAAVGNNGGGILGVAWNARLMPLNVWGANVGIADVNVARAVTYAVENGADVINLSLGGFGDSLVERDAIDFAVAHGLVVVAAAGNDAIDVKSVSPADLDGVIAVGAVDHLDQPSFFSNFGGKIELTAPGGGDSGPPSYQPIASVLSTMRILFDPRLVLYAQVPPDSVGQYTRNAGTSAAAPHVSGTAALILSRHPEFTVEQVRQVLRDSADDLGPPGRDARYGYGRLNAARAVAIDAVAVARLNNPQHLRRLHDELVTVEGTVQNPGGGTPSWQLLFGPQGQALNVIASGSGEVDHGVLASVDTAPLARGNYTLRLEVAGPNGATASDTSTFTRLASRPYIRQLTDQAGVVFLSTNALSDDARTLLWANNPHPGTWRVQLTDLAGRDTVIAEFQLGNDLFGNPFPVPTAISGDGSTAIFAAPEDQDRANIQFDNRNFQLFLYDTGSATIEQLTLVVGGSFPSFQGLSIASDGSRLAFISGLDLDPTVGNADGNYELFYWDRGTNAIRQVTSTLGSQGASAPAMTPDGTRIAFSSAADLDPSVGNPTTVPQIFLYDVARSSFRQLTHYAKTSPPLVQGTGGEVAISPDGSTVAGSTTAVYVNASNPQPNTQTVFVVDVASGETTEILTSTWLSSAGSAVPQFSHDGAELFFAAPTDVDPVFPFNPPFQSPRALFQHDFASGALRKLTGFETSAAVPACARIPVGANPSDVGLDPEGANTDGGLNVGVSGTTAEIFMLDPDTGGGFLHVKHGRVTQTATAGGDRFTVSGSLFQPSATLDPSSNEVSLTLLSANGQIFRATLPAGAMRRSGRNWRMSNARVAGVAGLAIRTTDGVHYTFRASGQAAGLFLNATPYLTVEVQVGTAVFSNAQPWRIKGRRLTYP